MITAFTTSKVALKLAVSTVYCAHWEISHQLRKLQHTATRLMYRYNTLVSILHERSHCTVLTYV